MLVQIIEEAWDILLSLLAMLIGLINWIFFYRHLEKKDGAILEKLAYRSLIKLPTIINLDPYNLIEFLLKDDKKTDLRTKVHKRIQLICLITFVSLLIHALIFRRFQ